MDYLLIYQKNQKAYVWPTAERNMDQIVDIAYNAK